MLNERVAVCIIFVMEKRIALRIVIIVALIIGVGFYLNNSNQNKSVIKIGVIAPLSGIAADYGKDMMAGIQSALHENVEFVFEDDACDAKTAVSAFTKLVIYHKVKVIIGPGCGSAQEAIAPLLSDNGVVVFTPAAASRDLYSRSSGNFYNVQYSLEDEAKFLADQITASGISDVVLISYQNAFSLTHANSFRESYKGNIVQEISFVAGDSDVSTELVKLRGKEFGAIVVTDISFFFAQGLAELQKFGIDAQVYSSYVVELPAAQQFVHGVKYSFPGDITNDKGATYALSKHAAEIVVDMIGECKNNVQCIKKAVRDSNDFDEHGVFKRNIILKEIIKKI